MVRGLGGRRGKLYFVMDLLFLIRVEKVWWGYCLFLFSCGEIIK